MGIKSHELVDGCFAHAMDDEPMFVLLARDPIAPEYIESWAMNRQNEIQEGQRPQADMERVKEARQCAANMRAWRIANEGKWRRISQ